MKILFPYMARWHAVNWTRYHSLLTALADKGHQIYVLQTPKLVSDETNYQDVEAVEHHNIKIIDVPVNNAVWNKKVFLEKIFKKGYFSFKAYQHSRKMIKDESIDVVLLYNIPQYAFTKIKDAVQVFDFADDYVDMLSFELGKLDNFLIRGLATYLLNSMMNKADLTLSVSYELAKQGKGNVHVLPNGVNLNEDASLSNEYITLVKNQDKPVVGFLGSFEYFIDLDLIIDAAIKSPEYLYLLVGYGRDWDHVQNRVQNENISNIVLTGGVPHTDIFSYIDLMDVCLNIFKPIPVSHRACPIKLFEYMSRKKPVISTRLHELEYIDKDFLYYADSADELVSVVTEIFESSDKSIKNSEAGYNEVVENYTWDKIATEFERHISEIKK